MATTALSVLGTPGIPQVFTEKNPTGVITVTLVTVFEAESAQPVTDQLVAAGIKAVLNFAPSRLKVGRDVRLKNVDLSIELETLSFYLAKGAR